MIVHMVCKEESAVLPPRRILSQIRDIQLVGGANASKFTRAVLRHVMTDSLAKIYSWSGQRKTLKFSSTVICQLIIKTIFKQTDATRTSIKETIKSWLQHATDRMR